MPETPSWLVSKGKHDAANQSLKRLRDSSNDNQLELSQLIDQASGQQSGSGFTLSAYGSKKHLCPLLLSLGLMWSQQFSGINAVMFYATNIFVESGSSISPQYATIIIGASQVPATIVGSLLVDRLGRKVLLCISGTLHVISTASLGFYYYATASQESNSFGWVPVASLVIFIIGFSVGWGPIPWLMVAEITPQTSRSATSALATAFNWTCAFLITKNFESLNEAITKHGTFLLFAAFALLSIIFTVFCLPETKGKSEEEIQRHFAPSSSNKTSNTSADKMELDRLNA